MTPRQLLEDELRAEMELAYAKWQLAKKTAKTLAELSVGIPHPDGALMRSGEMEAFYLKRYAEALSRFTNALCHGITGGRRGPGSERVDEKAGRQSA